MKLNSRSIRIFYKRKLFIGGEWGRLFNWPADTHIQNILTQTHKYTYTSAHRFICKVRISVVFSSSWAESFFFHIKNRLINAGFEFTLKQFAVFMQSLISKHSNLLSQKRKTKFNWQTSHLKEKIVRLQSRRSLKGVFSLWIGTYPYVHLRWQSHCPIEISLSIWEKTPSSTLIFCVHVFGKPEAFNANDSLLGN